MSDASEKKWYVIRGISGQENKIKDYIEGEVNRLNISSFVEDVIVPTQKVYKFVMVRRLVRKRFIFLDTL